MNSKFSPYVDLLLKWQKSVNLVSPNTLNEIWDRHIKDSLQLAKFIGDDVASIIDIGSGAGLPGIILAIEKPLPVWLIESDRKKCLFLQEVARQMELTNVKVVNERVEKAKIESPQKKIIVTARALADVKKLFELINSLLENNTIDEYRLLLLKGKNVMSEISEAEKFWEFDYNLEKSETDNASSILIIDNFKKR